MSTRKQRLPAGLPSRATLQVEQLEPRCMLAASPFSMPALETLPFEQMGHDQVSQLSAQIHAAGNMRSRDTNGASAHRLDSALDSSFDAHDRSARQGPVAPPASNLQSPQSLVGGRDSQPSMSAAGSTRIAVEWPLRPSPEERISEPLGLQTSVSLVVLPRVVGNVGLDAASTPDASAAATGTRSIDDARAPANAVLSTRPTMATTLPFGGATTSAELNSTEADNYQTKMLTASEPQLPGASAKSSYTVDIDSQILRGDAFNFRAFPDAAQDQALLELFPFGTTELRNSSQQAADTAWQLESNVLRELRDSLDSFADDSLAAIDASRASWFSEEGGFIELSAGATVVAGTAYMTNSPICVRLEATAGTYRQLQLSTVANRTAELVDSSLLEIFDRLASHQTAALESDTSSTEPSHLRQLAYPGAVVIAAGVFFTIHRNRRQGKATVDGHECQT